VVALGGSLSCCFLQLAACSGWLHAASSQFCGPYLLVCLQPCFMPALEHLIWKHVWTHSGRNFEQYGGITVSCNCLRCSMWVPSWILASRPLQVVGCCNVLCECITGICLLAIGGHLAVVKEHPTFFFPWAYLGLIFFAMQVCHKRMMQVSNPSPMLSLLFLLGDFRRVLSPCFLLDCKFATM